MTDTETLLGVVNNRLKLEGIPPIERKRKKKEHKYICKYCGTKCCDPNNICYACSGKLGAFRKIKNMKPKEVVK